MGWVPKNYLVEVTVPILPSSRSVPATPPSSSSSKRISPAATKLSLPSTDPVPNAPIVPEGSTIYFFLAGLIHAMVDVDAQQRPDAEQIYIEFMNRRLDKDFSCDGTPSLASSNVE